MGFQMRTYARHELSPRFPVFLHVRLPASVHPILGKAAEKNLMTSAEYIRRSVIDRLQVDGFDPTQLAAEVG
jgi:hypothetical protein